MKWEYKQISVAQPASFMGSGMVEGLNKHGADGWELIQIITEGAQMSLFFKRLKTEG